MFSRLAKYCVLVFLALSIGGQWALLQSVAWMGMMIDYSRDGSIAGAVCKTFDGKHPCPLCKAIAAGKKSEQKKAVSSPAQKLEFALLDEDNAPILTARFPLFLRADLRADSTSRTPPTPPPRFLFV